MSTTTSFFLDNYDLAATLTCGQAFRWKCHDNAWESVIHGRWVQLRQFNSPHSEQPGVGSFDVQVSGLHGQRSTSDTITATTADPQADWHWLTGYLRLNEDHAAAVTTLPDDPPMRAAISHCHGLRLLRQDPWECLASFILSSTKQIVQIRHCVELLCERFGEPIPQARGAIACHSTTAVNGRRRMTRPAGVVFAFPTAERLAAASEAELRACKIGFRAKFLQATARRVALGELDLATISSLPIESAREQLMCCPGVGRKIADCTLLFSCGFDAAFPIDVWVERALRQLYFPRVRASKARIDHFAATHFGPHAGLAQQYLFHYLRTRGSNHANKHAS